MIKIPNIKNRLQPIIVKIYHRILGIYWLNLKVNKIKVMTINIQFVKMETSESLSAFITEKLQNIFKKYEWIIRIDVFIKVENDPTEMGNICDMEVSLPGPKLFATSNEKNYEMAVKETISDIERQLKKRKAKFIDQNISS